ncbi:MAG: hypothetical protein H7X94_09715 [Vallitaleaceae bacterium]|nr:hypothetical protein [Vallitaleaceae bacterium]
MWFNNYAQLLNTVKMDWGKKSNKARDFKVLREEYELVKDPDGQMVGDQTWHDLEMDTLFLDLDRTKTYAGSLMLYKSLRETKNNVEEIERKGRQIDVLAHQPGIREPIQVALARLGSHDLTGLLYFLDRKLFFEPIFRIIAYILMVMPFVSLGLMVYGGTQFLTLLVVSIISNVIMYFAFTKYLIINKDHFTVVRNMIICATKIGQVENVELEQYTKPLKDLSGKCKSIVIRSKGLEFLGNDLTGFAVYIDMLLMISIRTFYRILDLINLHQKDLVEMYKLIGATDAVVGMASYRSSLKDFCKPEFTYKPKVLELKDAYNPLIKNSIKNSIMIHDENIYLTGSNMSGKSTFLRTVGINALMAQTFGFAFAKFYHGSMFKIFSSISRNDNLLEGKSYFLAEAEIVLDMLKQSDDAITSLIIIDEIFRGTNTKERIEASAGVLNYLAKQNALVFVATHDLEIKDKAHHSYKNYHFGENVGEGGIEFDYKIKAGTTVVGNALKILKYLGYPDEMFESEVIL